MRVVGNWRHSGGNNCLVAAAARERRVGRSHAVARRCGRCCMVERHGRCGCSSRLCLRPCGVHDEFVVPEGVVRFPRELQLRHESHDDLHGGVHQVAARHQVAAQRRAPRVTDAHVQVRAGVARQHARQRNQLVVRGCEGHHELVGHVGEAQVDVRQRATRTQDARSPRARSTDELVQAAHQVRAGRQPQSVRHHRRGVEGARTQRQRRRTAGRHSQCRRRAQTTRRRSRSTHSSSSGRSSSGCSGFGASATHWIERWPRVRLVAWRVRTRASASGGGERDSSAAGRSASRDLVAAMSRVLRTLDFLWLLLACAGGEGRRGHSTMVQ